MPFITVANTSAPCWSMPHQGVGDGAKPADVNENGRGRETAAQLAGRVLLQNEVWNEIVHSIILLLGAGHWAE